MPNVPRYRLFSGIKKRNSFQAAVCQYAERDAIGLITPLLLGYSVVTCLPAVHKRDDLRLFACFLISPRLIGAEIVPEAVLDAKRNALENGIENAEFICADAGEAAQELSSRGIKPDVVLLDPPRKGCSEMLLAEIVKMSPERIVYVSCDPSTLARDCFRLKDLGYETKRLAAADLFPRTVHVESVALLTKQK